MERDEIGESPIDRAVELTLYKDFSLKLQGLLLTRIGCPTIFDI